MDVTHFISVWISRATTDAGAVVRDVMTGRHCPED